MLFLLVRSFIVYSSGVSGGSSNEHLEQMKGGKMVSSAKLVSELEYKYTWNAQIKTVYL